MDFLLAKSVTLLTSGVLFVHATTRQSPRSDKNRVVFRGQLFEYAIDGLVAYLQVSTVGHGTRHSRFAQRYLEDHVQYCDAGTCSCIVSPEISFKCVSIETFFGHLSQPCPIL